MARILGWGHAGVQPDQMGIGPVKAALIALNRAGLTLDQIDVIEANEAFAAQACAVAKLLAFDPAKVLFSDAAGALAISVLRDEAPQPKHWTCRRSHQASHVEQGQV